MVPAPTPYATSIPSYAYLPTVAPLTTLWTPPAACASAAPTVFLGSCGGYAPGTCSAYLDDGEVLYQLSEYGAFQDYAYWTTSSSQYGLSCFPPSIQLVSYFSYYPAIGCPAGYQTVSTDDSYYNSGMWALCCPSPYTRFTSFSGYFQCWKYITTTGQPIVAAAEGRVYVTDSYGYEVDSYTVVSVISTTTITSIPSYGPLIVWATGIAMVIPSSWISNGAAAITTMEDPFVVGSYQPTSTSGGYGYSYPTSPANSRPKFSVFHLSFGLSIFVLILIGIAGCFGLCFSSVVIQMCSKARRRYTPRPNPSLPHSLPTYPDPHSSSPSALFRPRPMPQYQPPIPPTPTNTNSTSFAHLEAERQRRIRERERDKRIEEEHRKEKELEEQQRKVREELEEEHRKEREKELEEQQRKVREELEDQQRKKREKERGKTLEDQPKNGRRIRQKKQREKEQDMSLTHPHRCKIKDHPDAVVKPFVSPADEKLYVSMFDQGPRRGRPRFRDLRNLRKTGDQELGSGSDAAIGKKVDFKVVSGERKDQKGWDDKVDYSGMQDEGPTYKDPVLSEVGNEGGSLAGARTGKTASAAKSQNTEAPTKLERSLEANGSTTSRTSTPGPKKKGWDKGLQRGEPRFRVRAESDRR